MEKEGFEIKSKTGKQMNTTKIQALQKEIEIGKVCGKIKTKIINSTPNKFAPITEKELLKINRECWKDGYRQAKAKLSEAKFQTEQRIKDLEEEVINFKAQRGNLEELRKYIAKADEDGESSLWQSFGEVWYFNVNQIEELTKKINELKQESK